MKRWGLTCRRDFSSVVIPSIAFKLRTSRQERGRGIKSATDGELDMTVVVNEGGRLLRPL